MADATIKYHPGFVSGLEVLLWDYKDQIEIEAEKCYKGEIKGEIKGAIKAYYEVGILPSDIIIRIVSRFSLSRAEAEQYVEQTPGLEKV